MTDALTTYFNGEKNAALFIAGVGILALAAAAFFHQPRWEMRSFAITLAAIAIVEIAIGVGLYARTGPEVSGLLTQLGTNPADFFSDESARMARVQRNFVLIQYVEIAVLVIGAIVAFTQKNRFVVSGIALALVVHAAFLLAFDLVAERRGAAYMAAIERGNTSG